MGAIILYVFPLDDSAYVIKDQWDVVVGYIDTTDRGYVVTCAFCGKFLGIHDTLDSCLDVMYLHLHGPFGGN